MKNRLLSLTGVNEFLPSKHFSKDGISIRAANKISNKYTLTYKKNDLDFNMNFSINPITRGVNFNKEVLSSNKNYKIDLDIYRSYYEIFRNIFKRRIYY